MEKIEPGSHLSEDQQRAVAAALALRGFDAKGFAQQHRLSYSRLLRMLRGDDRVTASYAAHLSDLVRLHLVQPIRSRAFAHAA